MFFPALSSIETLSRVDSLCEMEKKYIFQVRAEADPNLRFHRLYPKKRKIQL